MESNSFWQKFARFTAFFVAVLAVIQLSFAKEPVPMKPVDAETVLAEVALTDGEGKPYTLEQHEGKVVLLHFWATWCPPCIEELPALLEYVKKQEENGLVFVPVSEDRDPAKVKAFLAQHGFTMPVIMDTQMKTMRASGVRGVPSTVMLDKEGKVKYVAEGAQYWDDPMVIEPIQSLLSGQPIPNQNSE